MTEDFKKRVIKCIADQTGILTPITPEDKLVDDLDFDELDVVELVIVLEEEFDDELPGDGVIEDEEMAKLEVPGATVQTVIDMMANLVGE